MKNSRKKLGVFSKLIKKARKSSEFPSKINKKIEQTLGFFLYLMKETNKNSEFFQN